MNAKGVLSITRRIIRRATGGDVDKNWIKLTDGFGNLSGNFGFSLKQIADNRWLLSDFAFNVEHDLSFVSLVKPNRFDLDL